MSIINCLGLDNREPHVLGQDITNAGSPHRHPEVLGDNHQVLKSCLDS